jgi:hypothetical protein
MAGHRGIVWLSAREAGRLRKGSSMKRWVVCTAFMIVAFGADRRGIAASHPAQHKTENIIFVMTDGMRWQKLFRGADATLMNKENGSVEDVPALRKAYWRDTEEERRRALMPFLWDVVARQGQVYGNREKGSDAYVTNGLDFSYPGYSETLCGFADPRINSNDNVPNPNVTVLEWLNRQSPYHGRIAAFGAWNVISAVFNPERSGLVANAGYLPFTAMPPNARLELLNQLKADGPTEYLNAAHRVDAYLRMLWETAQSMRQYRGKTTLIFSPDHGRGDDPTEWKDHGEKVPSSKYIWMAFLGPDTPALGERASVPAVWQNEIAATLAALLGRDYASAVPNAGKLIASVLGR